MGAMKSYPQARNHKVPSRNARNRGKYPNHRELLAILATVAAIVAVIGLSSCAGYVTQAGAGGQPGTSSALEIATTSLPSAANGVLYSTQLRAAGGVPPYKWSIISGALPAGITLDSSGNLFGVPTSVGTFDFTLQVVDSSTQTAQQNSIVARFNTGG